MSSKHHSSINNIAVIIGIVVTVIGLFAYRLIPERKLILVPGDPRNFSIYATNLPDGKPAGAWLSQKQLKFRCNYPKGYTDSSYDCSINRSFQYRGTTYIADQGIDLSVYDTLILKLKYQGTAPKLRFFARSYNAAYSNLQDSNSTKFNSVFLTPSDLRHTMQIPLSSFTVAEWWLLQYRIPSKYAHPDLTNVVNLGIDFSYPMTAGNHDVTLEKLEFTGEWIAQDTWYLGWLSVWMIGLLIHALWQLKQQRDVSRKNNALIDKLNTDNSRLQNESSLFRRLSTVDPLTQLYNRFGIDQIITSMIDNHEKRYIESAACLSIILVDIDWFKSVNDTYGHDAGDLVLQQMAELLQCEAGKNSFVGRWGGEEFIILSSNQELEDACAMAERIRHKVATTPFLIANDETISITISLGVGLCTNKDFPSAFKRVDTALYQAKHQGRNRVSIAENL